MKKIFKQIHKLTLKHKWKIHWAGFSLILTTLISISLFSEKTEWIKDIIQTLATTSGIYLTLIIFLQSKEESDKQFREQINQLQELNKRQIDSLTENTQKEIEALHNLTYEQISSFEQQISSVTNKLSDNSILLAEILGRELEKAINLYNQTLQKEKTKYKDLSRFKIGRTKEEREFQINNQLNRIQQIQNSFNYLMKKYNGLKKILGINNNKITKLD